MLSSKGFSQATQSYLSLCLLLPLILIGGVQYAWAAKTATNTTLTVTSGGVAVTEVPAMTVVTLTATVKAGTTAVELGTVNFCDASAKSCTDIYLLGTAQLTHAGTAAMKFRPGVGSHSYKAVFVSTTSDAASASSTAALTVTALAVTGVSPTTTAIANSGSPGDYTLTATVNGPREIASPTGTVSFLDTSNENSVLDTATLGAGTTGFGWLNSQNVYTYSSPQAAQVGDFNGDGILDIAAPGDASVTILLGKGDGTFTAKSSVGGCGTADSIAVADFNGDGIPDLAVTCPPDRAVNIYLGNGDGTFTLKSSPATGNWPNSVVAADFNGDGILDLAVANAPCCGSPFTPYLTILLGNGDGTFTAAPNAPAPGEPWGVSVGDFNGDGIPDLAFANSYASSNSVSILLGNGDGTFTAAASPATGGGAGGVVGVGDFNGDGKLDLAVWNGGNVLTLLLGNGDGAFTAAPASPITFANSGWPCPGDFNGDGILDFVVLNNSDNTARYLLGNGDGTFTTTVASPPLIGNIQACAVADFNGDGISDLVVHQYPVSSYTLAVWLTQLTQSATATASGISVVGASGTHQVEASYLGDVNHQGSTSGTVGLAALTSSTATHFLVTVPSNAGAYAPFTITVSALGANDGTVTGYTGTVSFTSSDGSAVLPAASNLTEGTGTFTVTLKTQGNQTITATDTANSLTGTSAAIDVGVTPQGVFAGQASVDFGSQAVGSASGTQTLSYRIGAGTTVGSIAVVTQGAANLDYTSAASSTCTATTYSSGTNCTVDVTFKPRAPGPRYGAVVFTDGSGDLLATTYVQGTGAGPQVTFANSTSGVYLPSKQIALGSGFSWPYGVAVDASGDIFITDGGHGAVKEIVAVNGSIPASPTIKTLATGFGWPYGVAVDGAGNVFVGDSVNRAVKEIVAAGGYTTVKNLGSGFSFPEGVAVDGSGNVFVADYNDRDVKEIVAAGGYTTVKTLASGFYWPGGVAVDGSGNVFVADFSNTVNEIVAAGGYTTVKTLGSGFGAIFSVAVDASGNLFVTDYDSGILYEILAAGGYTTIHTLSGGYSNQSGVAVDASGNVFIAGGDPGHVVKLDYTDPPSLTFANTQVGLQSGDSPQTVQIQNVGNQALVFTALSYPTDFPEVSGSGADPCTDSASLSSGQACDLNIGFTPLSLGQLSEDVTLTDNALNVNGATQSIPVSGTGTPNVPVVTLSQTSVAFGLQELNIASLVQSVTLTNSGNSTLTFRGLLTGTNAAEFSMRSTCTGTLAPSASCTIYFYFTPTALGAATAAWTITDNAGNSPQSIALSGTGSTVKPTVTLSQTSVAFGLQELNITSLVPVTLTNSGNINLIFRGLLTGTNAAEFSKWSTCTGTLAPGAFCTIYLNFTPTVAGPASAALTINDNASDSPQSIALSGTGTTLKPAVTLSQTSVAFGNQADNASTTEAPPVTLTNSGGSNLIFYGQLTGTNAAEFFKWSTCVGVLAPGASCTIHYYFTPTAIGPASATVIITDNAGNSPQSIALSGSGAQPAITLSRTSITLAVDLAYSQSSTGPPVTLTNNSGSTLTFYGQLTGAYPSEFSKSSTCTGTLAPSASCTVYISFNPTIQGNFSAALTITDNVGSPQQVLLTGLAYRALQ